MTVEFGGLLLTDHKYNVKVFVTSKGIESAYVLGQIKMLMEVMGEAIDLSVVYVLSKSPPGSTFLFSSINGPSEVAGDIIGRCVMNLYPKPQDYLPFLVCMGQDPFLVPQNALNCSFLHNIDMEAVVGCINFQSDSVLMEDYQTTSHYSLQTAPRILMDERSYSPTSSQTFESYEAAMCYVFQTPSLSFPWFIFILIAAVILFVVVVLLLVRQWSNSTVLEWLKLPFASELVSCFHLLKRRGPHLLQT